MPSAGVKITGGLWLSHLKTNRKVTIPHVFEQCERTGRIANFAIAGGLREGKHHGAYFNDSDVYKAIEGAARSLARHPDPQLKAYIDSIIKKIAAAQEADGYLYTARTIAPDDPPPAAGPRRWSNLKYSHELYCAGHLYEAAVAYYKATGDRSLLEVALDNARLVDRVFGPDGLHKVPGHEETAIGLVKLYRVTGERRWLDLAAFFLDQRGKPHGRELYGKHFQDHKPVVKQSKVVGHAVRGGYLYMGMADVAAFTGNQAYIDALGELWRDAVYRKMYITGNAGGTRNGEGFSDPYHLPNFAAYNETCAAIAFALWNHRMFLLHGEGKYIDVMERALYNGVLSGVSLSGDRFFYPNPLASNGKRPFNQGSIGRAPWFGTACCPTNIVRLIPQVDRLIYATRDDAIYVNLFVESRAEIHRPGADSTVLLEQETRYPWKGRVEITVSPQKPARFPIRVRIPGWAREDVVPGDLYHFLNETPAEPTLKVNGEPVSYTVNKGYAELERTWYPGDTIVLELPMPVRRVVANAKVKADRGRVALQRGPIVYCIEGADHGGYVMDIVVPDGADLHAEFRKDLLGGVSVITGQVVRMQRTEGGAVQSEPMKLTAIPYYAWANRKVGQMLVWLPRTAEEARPRPAPTIASTSEVSASHVWHGDTLSALNDRTRKITGSGDHSIPRFTWWNHKGTTEWVQYTFDEPTRISEAAVYWFADTARGGGCTVPAFWKLLYRDEGRWKPVPSPSGYGVTLDQYNKVTFDPVKTKALRLKVQLREGYSAGILEWRVGSSGHEDRENS